MMNEFWFYISDLSPELVIICKSEILIISACGFVKLNYLYELSNDE